MNNIRIRIDIINTYAYIKAVEKLREKKMPLKRTLPLSDAKQEAENITNKCFTQQVAKNSDCAQMFFKKIQRWHQKGYEKKEEKNIREKQQLSAEIKNISDITRKKDNSTINLETLLIDLADEDSR